jgi:hypothetical protein
MTPPPAETLPTHPWWYLFDLRYSLRARATLLVGAAALAFMLLANWFTGKIVRQSLEAQTGVLFETLAFEIGDKIDRVIYERQHQLHFLASLPAFRADSTGEVERRRLMEMLQRETPDLAWIGFASADGRIVAGTQGRFEQADVSSRPWFGVGRENRYVGGPREIPELPREGSPAEEGPARYLDVAVPVTGTDGRLAGVLIGNVRWSWARDVVRGIVPESLTRHQIGATIYAGSTDVLFDSGTSGWNLPPNAPTVPPRTFRGWLTESFPAGPPYLAGFARSRGFREFRGLGWLTVVRQPAARALAPAAELRSITGRWGLAFVATLMVATWVFFTPFVRRLRGVKASADRIRKGDILTVMPQHRGQTELSEMCSSLGALVEDLRQKQPPAPEAPVVEQRPPETRKSDYVKPTGTDPRRIVW